MTVHDFNGDPFNAAMLPVLRTAHGAVALIASLPALAEAGPADGLAAVDAWVSSAMGSVHKPSSATRHPVPMVLVGTHLDRLPDPAAASSLMQLLCDAAAKHSAAVVVAAAAMDCTTGAMQAVDGYAELRSVADVVRAVVVGVIDATPTVLDVATDPAWPDALDRVVGQPAVRTDMPFGQIWALQWGVFRAAASSTLMLPPTTDLPGFVAFAERVGVIVALDARGTLCRHAGSAASRATLFGTDGSPVGGPVTAPASVHFPRRQPCLAACAAAVASSAARRATPDSTSLVHAAEAHSMVFSPAALTAAVSLGASRSVASAAFTFGAGHDVLCAHVFMCL